MVARYTQREGKFVSNTNSEWFTRAALTVREIVVAHGGAVAMTKAELIQAIIEEDSSFKECPSLVLEHIQIPLGPRAELSSSLFDKETPSILLIHFRGMSKEAALDQCHENGLSESVRIAQLDRA